MVIPRGTTTCKQLSRLHTDPADLLHPAPDVCFLSPAGFATGLVARRCPRKDLHLLDNINRFHRGCQPRIPTVTSFTRHDSALFGPALVKDIGFPWSLPQIAPLTTLVVEELHALPYEEALCGAPDKPNCTRPARSTCCMSRAETLPMRLISRILLTVVS